MGVTGEPGLSSYRLFHYDILTFIPIYVKNKQLSISNIWNMYSILYGLTSYFLTEYNNFTIFMISSDMSVRFDNLYESLIQIFKFWMDIRTLKDYM
jgi:hypothetical protein